MLRLSVGKKTDKKDAKWIADLFKHDLVAGSFMPPADIRQLRDLMRYRFKLTCFKSSEKNRYQNCLTVSNIQLGNVVSDTFGKSSQKIIAKILENPDDTSFDIGSLIHGSMKDKLPELELAIDGYITPEQAAKLKIIKEHFDNLEARKAELEELILALANPYQQEISIILTAPGFKNTFTAIGIISEIGTNMELPSANTYVHGWSYSNQQWKCREEKNLSGFPRPDAISNHFLYSVQTLRSRAKKHPEIRDRYLRIKKRRGHKKAIIAIARMLLTALYHMLKNGENYNSDLYQKSDILPTTREITVEQAILMAQFQGFRIKSATE